MAEVLQEIISDFPLSPGVYIMKDKSGKIIYVGKAGKLKNRVRSYFSGSKDIKTRILVKHIESIEYIITNDEYEALLLENTLIKKWTPRYNIDLKDDKSYPSICVTREDFPRIFKTRNIRKDGSAYYGPFTSSSKLDDYLELINTIFPLRKCRGKLKKRETPCLYYHIGRCSAPCCGKITRKEYRVFVRKAEKLLNGETKSLIKDLKKEMDAASGELDFEKAAKMRNLIEAVKMVEEQAQVIEFDAESRDYIACYIQDTLCTFSVIRIRGGKINDRALFRTKVYGDEEDAFTEFFLHHYQDRMELPRTIYVSGAFDRESVEEFLNGFTDYKVSIIYPLEGRHFKIIRMAMENARQDVEKKARSRENTAGLKELKKVLGLPVIPVRIEGFDIAQLSGKYPVASLVSFFKGVPDKKNYRKFHIKTLDGAIDDYEAIREVIARRYTRVINEGLVKPDLIIIDGGKGQVNAAKGILDSLGLSGIPLIGLAKKNEEIFLPGESGPVILPDTSEALRIVQAVRDETHRFATNFNKQLREKELVLSELGKIPGIGLKRSRNLLLEFGSLESLAAAESADLMRKAGLSEEAAERVHKYLSGNVVKKFDNEQE